MPADPSRLVPPCVPAGTLAAGPQPEFDLGGARLRPFTASDAPRVVEAFEDPLIQYFHARRLDLAGAEAWITNNNELWSTETSATWAIADAEDDRMLGRISLHLQPAHGIAEVAYWLLPEGRGRHLVSGAVRTVVEWAHGVGIHRIELEHHPDNENSRRVAEACGFTFEGIKRDHHALVDGRHDAWSWSHLTGEPLVRASGV